MALVELKSNLKNLKVDKDRPFGGSSGLPYIKGGLPEDSPAGESIANLARYNSDGLVRGGLFSVVSSTTDTIRISRFLNDFPKGLLFTSKQVGLQKSNPKIETGTRGEVLNTQVYNLNSNLLAQVALQGTGEHVPRPGFNTNNLLNDYDKYEKIVRDKTTDENRLVTLYNNKIAPASSKILPDNLGKLGISTLDNELFNYTGGPGSSYGDGNTFIPRVVNTTDSYDNYLKSGFTYPTYDPEFASISAPEGDVINYLGSLGLTDLIKTKSIPGLKDLLYPRKSRGFVTPTSFQTPTTIGNASLQTPFVASNIDLSGGIENIDFEEGDFLQNIKVPKSRYQQSSPDFIRPETVPEGYTFGNTMAYSKLLSSIPGQLQDFRQNTIDPNPLASNYSDTFVEINSRLNMGNPGSRTRANRGLNSINNINNGVGQDKINLTPLYNHSGDPLQDKGARDMIKFCIEVIDNNTTSQTSPLHFRAYITDFSDNIGADWNSQKYMGRGENFYTYQGFSREVSFKLMVAAQSKQEMMPLYQKLNFLASSLHPDYSSGGFMRGNLHKLTIGEWFYRTPGILKSMNISVDNNYPWEIKYTEPETGTQVGNASNTTKFGAKDFQKNVPQNFSKIRDIKPEIGENFQNSNSDADMMELPQMLSIQFSFVPILNNLPKLAKDINSNFTSTPILISDHGDKENFIKRIVN